MEISSQSDKCRMDDSFLLRTPACYCPKCDKFGSAPMASYRKQTGPSDARRTCPNGDRPRIREVSYAARSACSRKLNSQTWGRGSVDNQGDYDGRIRSVPCRRCGVAG